MLKSKGKPQFYKLRLYVTGTTARSQEAMDNVTVFCEKNLPGLYSLEIIDLYQHPNKAKSNQIAAVPALINLSENNAKRVVGNLSDNEKLLMCLNLKREIDTQSGSKQSLSFGK